VKRIVLVLIAVSLLPILPAPGGRGAEPKEVSELMKKKLKHAQRVLEGVAVKDFDLISQSAEELVVISNQAEWMVLKTPKYTVYSNDFKRDAEALIKNAKDKNLDAAALAYVDLTLTCVKCHKHVREERMTRLDSGRDFGE
jgi:hypothetical protein